MIFVGDYSFYETEIRKTKLGQIYECKNNRNQQNYYVEKIPKENIREEHKKILDIIKNSTSKNKNILKIYDVIQKDAFIYIITEQYDYTLQEYVDKRNKNQEKLQEEEIKEFMYQIVDGYLYLIKHQIIHGDLNFSTIVIKQQKNLNLFKLAQSNHSILKTSKLSKNQNIRMIFQAPELLEDQRACQTEKSDIFSFGLILLQIQEQKYLKSIDTIPKLKQFLKTQKEKKNSNNNNQDFDELQIIIENTIVYEPENRCHWTDLQRKNIPQNNSSEVYSTTDTGQEGIDNYEISGQIINKGNQGCILHARKLNSQEEYVAKQLIGDETEIKREIELYNILKNSKHENIIQFVDKVIKNSITYLIMEKCEESLQDYKKKIKTDEKIKDFMQQITSGFLFLKEKNILHRDLKPQNIMIKYKGDNKPIYKIIDFGVGKQLLSTYANTKTGTPAYMAPEVYFFKKHDYQCDVFSLGLILYEIVYQQRLIQKDITTQNIDNFYHQIQNQPYKCPFYHNSNLQDLIEKMIVYNPEERIQWNDILKHPFLKRLEIQELLFQIYQLAKNILNFIQNNFRQLNLEIIIQIRNIILQFCLETLTYIFNICNKGVEVIENKEFKLQQELSDSQQWLKEIKFSEEVESIRDISEQLNEEEIESLKKKKGIIKLQNEFKDQYFKHQEYLKCFFNNFVIQNSIERFRNIFEDTPLAQSKKSQNLIESIIPNIKE